MSERETIHGDKENPNEKFIQECYQDFREWFASFGLELTMAEAAYLRELIKQCLENNQKVAHWDKVFISDEVPTRFFLEYIGVNVDDYLIGAETYEERLERRKQLAQLIKEKLRPERELI